LPLIASAKAEPMTFSMLLKLSCWASPPDAVLVERLSVTPAT